VETTRKLVAEALGTFFLCFAGIAAILSNTSPINSGAGLVGVALAHGLALAIAISCFGGISGGHHNPAVTLGFLSTGRITPALAVLYIISQLIGAICGAGVCRHIFPDTVVEAAKLGIPLPPDLLAGEPVTVGVVLLAEFVMTFLLMTAVYGAAVDERGKVVKIGAFAIGLTVTFDILAGGPVTGASMNPARSFGPSLAFHYFGPLHWCYWVAPIAGGVAAALLYEHVLLEKKASK
jgi:MIP family channel proteins